MLSLRRYHREKVIDREREEILGKTLLRKSGAMAVGEKASKVTVHLALLIVQVGYGGYYVLSKKAMTDGVDRFVFAVYRDCIALTVLVPLAYFSERNVRPAYTWSVGLLTVALGFSGIYLQQTLFLAGLAYTNSGFASAMQNAIPVFTFLIALICRVEVIRIRKLDGIAKLLGILICICGAVTMSLYKGSILLGENPVPTDPLPSRGLYQHQDGSITEDGWLTEMFLRLGMDHWQMGSLYLVGNCLCMGVYTNLQVPTLRKFPAPISLTASSIFVGTIGLITTGAFTVSESSQWVISRPGNIVSVAYAGLIASGLNFTLQTWSNQRGGPVLLAAYIPLQTVFSAVLGLVVLNEALYSGTVIGAIFILTGLYLVIWGQRAHSYSQELQAALPYCAVIGDDKKTPLLPTSRSDE